ncbi:MAG: PIG-L deacetylase family protein [Promethearchaeota archaeon]
MNDELFSSKKPMIILIVEAHPDDAAFFAGGTIAKLVAQGHTIFNLCSTYGEKGTLNQEMILEKMIDIEKDEAQKAAKILGIKEVIHLGIPDGELTAGLELRRQYTEVIRRVRPDIVFSFDPNCPYEPHPDHRAAGRTIFEACFTSHYHLYYPEHQKRGLKPHYVFKLYGWNSPKPNTYIDITDVLETKIKALQQYESQMHMLLEETQHRLKLANMEIPILKKMDWREATRFWVTISAQNTGKLAKYQYAEAFNGISFGLVGAISEMMKTEP